MCLSSAGGGGEGGMGRTGHKRIGTDRTDTAEQRESNQFMLKYIVSVQVVSTNII